MPRGAVALLAFVLNGRQQCQGLLKPLYRCGRPSGRHRRFDSAAGCSVESMLLLAIFDPRLPCRFTVDRRCRVLAGIATVRSH